MKKTFLLITFIAISYISKAQIVNIETLRFMSDSNGIVGQIQGSYNYKVDKVININTSAGLHLGYKYNKHFFLNITSFGYNKIDENEVSNNFFEHFRYDYSIASSYIFEGFAQTKYDKFVNIQMRTLFGSGLRIKFIHKPKARLYTGITGMYEYEELTDKTKNEGARMSDYISFVYSIDLITFSYTTYYQPRFTDFSEFRFTSNSSIKLKVWKNLGVFSSFDVEYDNNRPEGIPKTVTDFKSGLSYSF